MRVLLDVRTKKEYSHDHLPGSINFPVKLPPITLQERALIYNDLVEFLGHHRILKDDFITVYCKKGIRSTLVVDMLKFMGYYNVVNLGGVDIH